MKMQAAFRRARITRPSLSWRRSSRLLASNHAQPCSTTQRMLPSPEPCASPTDECGAECRPSSRAAVVGAVVGRVGVQPADGGADDLGQAQQMGQEPRIVDVGGRGNHTQREAVGGDHDMVFGPWLASVRGVGPVSSPPRLARTEQLSTTTSQGAASGPARTMRTSTAWTRRSRAVALQSSRRPAGDPARAGPDLQWRPDGVRARPNHAPAGHPEFQIWGAAPGHASCTRTAAATTMPSWPSGRRGSGRWSRRRIPSSPRPKPWASPRRRSPTCEPGKVHETQLRASMAMLAAGKPEEEIVAAVLEATRAVAGPDWDMSNARKPPSAAWCRPGQKSGQARRSPAAATTGS